MNELNYLSKVTHVAQLNYFQGADYWISEVRKELKQKDDVSFLLENSLDVLAREIISSQIIYYEEEVKEGLKGASERIERILSNEEFIASHPKQIAKISDSFATIFNFAGNGIPDAVLEKAYYHGEFIKDMLAHLHEVLEWRLEPNLRELIQVYSQSDGLFQKAYEACSQDPSIACCYFLRQSLSTKSAVTLSFMLARDIMKSKRNIYSGSLVYKNNDFGGSHWEFQLKKGKEIVTFTNEELHFAIMDFFEKMRVVGLGQIMMPINPPTNDEVAEYANLYIDRKHSE